MRNVISTGVWKNRWLAAGITAKASSPIAAHAASGPLTGPDFTNVLMLALAALVIAAIALAVYLLKKPSSPGTLHRPAFSALPEMAFAIDPATFEILFANDMFCAATGFSPLSTERKIGAYIEGADLAEALRMGDCRGMAVSVRAKDGFFGALLSSRIASSESGQTVISCTLAKIDTAGIMSAIEHTLSMAPTACAMIETASKRLAYANDALLLMTGYDSKSLPSISLDEILAEKDGTTMLRPRTAPAVNVRVQRKAAASLQGYELLYISPVKRIESEAQPEREMLARISRSIAHDFNNALAIIMSNMELVKMHSGAGSDEYIGRINEALTRCRQMVRNMAVLSNLTPMKTEPVNLAELVSQTLSLLSKTLPSENTLSISVPAEAWLMDGDPGRLQLLVINLFNSSIRATSENTEPPHIAFSVENVSIPAGQISGHAPGQYLRLRVHDNGTSISKKAAQSMLRQSFCDDASLGNGLSLPSIVAIVTDHRGIIDFDESADNEHGINIYFPKSAAQPRKQDTQPQEGYSGGAGTILLVEDERHLADSTSEMLAILGYSVITKYSGHEAIETYRQRAEDVNLVLMDMVMPGISGRKLFQEFRNIRPDGKILITSGQSVDGEQVFQDKDTAVMEKPFTLYGLSATINRMLGTSVTDITSNIKRLRYFCINEKTIPHSQRLLDTAVVYDLFRNLAGEQREKFIVVLLGDDKSILAYDEITQGSHNEAVVFPQEVLKSAIVSNATAILLVHNHPSGSLEPSQRDIVITANILQSCNMLGIELIDHVIISREGYLSFKSDGLL